MTDTSTTTPLQAEPASPSEVAGLNARTARRQRLLLGGIGALALVGGSWFILGDDDSKTSQDPQATQTIDTAGLVNRLFDHVGWTRPWDASVTQALPDYMFGLSED